MGGLLIPHSITIIRQDEHEKFGSILHHRKASRSDGSVGPFVLVDENCRSARAFPSIPVFLVSLELPIGTYSDNQVIAGSG